MYFLLCLKVLIIQLLMLRTWTLARVCWPIEPFYKNQVHKRSALVVLAVEVLASGVAVGDLAAFAHPEFIHMFIHFFIRDLQLRTFYSFL
jgi:hypothetical protein